MTIAILYISHHPFQSDIERDQIITLIRHSSFIVNTHTLIILSVS